MCFRSSFPPAAFLAAILLVSLPLAGAPAPEPERLRQELLELLNAERQRQGLGPLALDPRLSAAAQAHADDMMAKRYYDLRSPDGREIEQWVEEAGYQYQLVTEKLVNKTDTPQRVVEIWRQNAQSHRNSVFSPEVEHLGIGLGTYNEVPLYTFVLARSRDSYLAEYTKRLFQEQTERLRDLDSLRKEMLERINEARAEVGLPALEGNAALDRAAQAHADAVYRVLKRGGRLMDAGPLGARVAQQGYRSRGGIGESIVQGALTPEQTLASILEEHKKKPSLLLTRGKRTGKNFSELGLGVAFEREGDDFRVVWVQCLARPASVDDDENQGRPSDLRAEWISQRALRVRSIEPADEDFSDLQPLKKVFGDTRVVMLGEAGHGDGAAFLAKTRLIKFLHQEMGFDVLAFESGLYECRKAWDLLRGGEDATTALRRAVFGVWSRSEQVQPLMDYIGRQARGAKPLEVAGFDDQLTGSASEEFLLADLEAFLRRIEAPVLGRGDWPRFQESVKLLFPLDTKPPDQTTQKLFFRVLGEIETEIPAAPEAAFWRRVLSNLRGFAEMTWRLDPLGKTREGHSLRDGQMADNVLWLAREAYPRRKIIVWAATRHIARNPERVEDLSTPPTCPYDGYAFMGSKIRKELGEQVYALGFASYEGATSMPRLRDIGQAPYGSLEWLFRESGVDLAVLDLRNPPAYGGWTRQKLVSRLFGHTEMRADWSQILDGVFFIRLMTPSVRVSAPEASP
ncbi:MAG TPA: erythromycin esterase family protein [Thermoanaerobaculia bacterium]